MTDNLFGDINLSGNSGQKQKKITKSKTKKVELNSPIILNNGSIFGEEYTIQDITKKACSTNETKEIDAEKALKSKKLSLQERLAIINTGVLKVLGKQKANVLVIKDKQTLHEYISKAIAFGRIAIDTETNNSLDPVTCKLMGPCFYYSGGKQAYVPINHRNPETKERLDWQLTEQDIAEELNRINEAKTMIIMHNGKFDYEVLKCTTGVECVPDWDTMVAARLLNENELAGLKWQYTHKIDKSQEKYSIDKLFEKVAYADVDPDIFALYAATDPMMTDKLYEIQKIEFDKPEYDSHKDLLGTHEIKGLRWLFHNVEMPIVIVTAEMELHGVAVDEEYGARLKEKYTKQLENSDKDITDILDTLKSIISAWKITPEAAAKQKIYVSKKTKMSEEKILQQYPEIDDIGRFKYGKSAVEQLEDPINLASPSQLAILFYDILGVPNKAKDGSRKTGKDELKTIKETLAGYLPKLEEIETELDLEEDEDVDDVEEAIELSADQLTAFKLGSAAKLADLILKRRGIAKLVTTYIDVIPELVKHWPDGRIRFHLNSLGTDTGRYSSGGKLKFMENDEAVEVSGINIQNIPSHNPEIRMLFKAAKGCKIIGSDYSAQEPRMTTFLSGDKNMYNAYLNGKDLYAMIAQSAYHNEYWENLEFWPEGTEIEIDGQKVIAGKKTHLNKAGKERRSVGKVLNLAATYGMSGRTAGIRLGYIGDEAAAKGQELLDNFFEGFKGVDTAIKSSKEFLKKTGYVEDFLGRRRRLEDINLDPYEAKLKVPAIVSANFNPFLNCGDRQDLSDAETVWNMLLSGYVILSNAYQLSKDMIHYEVKNEMSNSKFDNLKKIAANPKYMLNQTVESNSKYEHRTNRQKFMDDMQVLKQILVNGHYKQGRTDCMFEDNEQNKAFYNLINSYKAKYGLNVPVSIPDDPMTLYAWTGRIAQATRQCFNARIQGSAASLTKLAMIDIYNDPQMKAWGAKLIIPVHDELLVECPEEYADLVEKRLPEIMINAAKRVGDDVPQSVDPYNVTRWYSDTMAATLLDEVKKLESTGFSREDAFAEVIKNHSELPAEAIIKVLTGETMDEIIF